MVDTLKKEWFAKLAFVYFLFITAWWSIIFLTGQEETFNNYLFGASYGLIALWGGIWGLIISKRWGGYSSALGRSIIVLSLGLLAQEFGQIIFSAHNIFLEIEIPYPSLADVGFFGSIPLYIYGIFLLLKASGVKFSFNKLVNQLQAFIIPLFMLSLSYLVFLKDYEFDYGSPLVIFLDFGYPFGEAIYISIAILTYSLSKNLLGGVMRNKIVFIVGAFIMQYMAEFNFLYQNSRGTWINGGYGDYLYFLAYFMMTIGLMQLKTLSDQLKN